jgi:excisionase family DNA binding protein
VTSGKPTLADAVDVIAQSLATALRPVIAEVVHDVLAEHEAAERVRPERVDCKTMAQLLDCSQAQIHRLCREEGLPFVRLGEVKRFDPTAVYAWLDARTADREASEAAE